MKKTIIPFYICILTLLVIAGCRPTHEDEDPLLMQIPQRILTQEEIDMLNDTSTCIFSTPEGKVLVTLDSTSIIPEPRGYYDFVAVQSVDPTDRTIMLYFDNFGDYDDKLELTFTNKDYYNGNTNKIKEGAYITGGAPYGNGWVDIYGTYMANGFWGEKVIEEKPGQKIYIKRIPGTASEAILSFCDFKMRWRYGESSRTGEGYYTPVTLNGYVKIKI